MSSFVPAQPNSFPPPTSNTMAQALPHPIMYTNQPPVHYLPQYYSPPYAQYGPSSYPERTLKSERRRPKYTRSKTGCLTCRKKKVKCDETKPSCQRCSNSHLTCTWPELPPPKKKAPARKSRAAMDQIDSATTSEAGTSSVSPIESTDLASTPHVSYECEVPSPEIEQGDASSADAPSMTFENMDMLQVGAGLNSDRRHSDPHIVPSLAPSAIELRRHSMADITEGQQYMHHNSHQEHQYPLHSHGHANNGALGLSLDQLNVNTRPSTPNDFLYPHARAQGSISSGFAGFSPSGGAVIPNISSATTSSRPSTAASSLSLSHSLRRTSAGSRPSTAGSYASGTAGASINSHQFMHRPTSSGGGPGTTDYPSLGFSPFSSHPGPGEVSIDAATAMNNYASACISRPSTANSVPSAAPSPYMQHNAVSLDGSGAVGIDRWRSSPLLGGSPLVHPQPHVIDGSGINGYFQHISDSPSLHSRTHSPAWAC